MLEHNYRTDRLMMRRQKAAELLEKSQAEQAASLEKQRLKEEQRQAKMAEKAAAKAEREANKERKKPAGRAILQLSDDLTLVRRFDSIADAVRETGVNSKSIRDAANGVQKRAGGYVWRYVVHD